MSGTPHIIGRFNKVVTIRGNGDVLFEGMCVSLFDY